MTEELFPELEMWDAFDWDAAYSLYCDVCEYRGVQPRDEVVLQNEILAALDEAMWCDPVYRVDIEGFVVVNSGKRLTLAYVPVFSSEKL